MNEVSGDLWEFSPADARVITTNGVVKTNGDAVMGKGTALEAASRFPGFARLLGERIRKKGNRVHVFEKETFGTRFDLVTFPTKHDWHDNADLDLITFSAVQLVELADSKFSDWKAIVMPRVGAGAGNLKWENVKHRILGLFDDRFYVVTFDQSDRRRRF